MGIHCMILWVCDSVIQLFPLLFFPICVYGTTLPVGQLLWLQRGARRDLEQSEGREDWSNSAAVPASNTGCSVCLLLSVCAIPAASWIPQIGNALGCWHPNCAHEGPMWGYRTTESWNYGVIGAERDLWRPPSPTPAKACSLQSVQMAITWLGEVVHAPTGWKLLQMRITVEHCHQSDQRCERRIFPLKLNECKIPQQNGNWNWEWEALRLCLCPFGTRDPPRASSNLSFQQCKASPQWQQGSRVSCCSTTTKAFCFFFLFFFFLKGKVQ